MHFVFCLFSLHFPSWFRFSFHIRVAFRFVFVCIPHIDLPAPSYIVVVVIAAVVVVVVVTAAVVVVVVVVRQPYSRNPGAHTRSLKLNFKITNPETLNTKP